MSPATGELAVRPLEAGDDDAVRRTFRDTILLGEPVPFALPDLDRYEDLCLGWYLGPGRRWAGLLVEHGGPGQASTPVGYVLVCPDQAGHARWLRRRAARFTARVLGGLVVGRYPRPARRFWWLRLRDGARSWRSAPIPPAPVHVHLNLDPHVRATRAGRLLADHADAVTRATGHGAWCGEMNTKAGRRAAALERLGGEVVHRTPNLTFSWARGEPVERLTAVRVVPTAEPAASGPTDGRPTAAPYSSSASRRRSTVASSTPMPAT